MPTITSVLPPSSSSRAADLRDQPAPLALALVVARHRQLARERQDQRHGVLGHRTLVRALRAGDADAGPAEQVARVLVGAGADRLDEGEPRRELDEVVAPEAGDAQHVGVADARLQLVDAAHLERADARVAEEEALLQPVGGVGEADGEVFSSRQGPAHGLSIPTTRRNACGCAARCHRDARGVKGEATLQSGDWPRADATAPS
jgi:hypothetical protein